MGKTSNMRACGRNVFGTIIAICALMSCNDRFVESQIVFNLPVDKTMHELLAGYDTDVDKKITKDDAPNKRR